MTSGTGGRENSDYFAGDVYQSEGCHRTELSLSCPAGEMLIIHSAHFTPSTNKLNCSSITQHSQRGR